MTVPVLFLGLGGTGKDTLVHIRRLILDAYNARMPDALLAKYGPARLPHTAYLCLDADDRMQDIDGRKFDEFLRHAQLSAGEFINVELDPRRVEELYDYPERHQEYARWFDFSLEKKGVPKNGCGQTRPWGRVAFFQHYPTIRDRLRKILGSLITADVAQDAKLIGVDGLQTNRIQVFVVFSVAGGTGSGLFLDTAFLLKELAAELRVTVNAEALILLPEVFSADPSSRVFANGYAALMELEYYNLRRDGAADLSSGGKMQGIEGVFPVYWPNTTGADEIRTLRGPVFEPIWLIGNRSRGIDGQGSGTALREEHRSDLTAMMAEWLFVRTAPSLAPQDGHGVTLDPSASADINTRASNYVSTEMVKTEKIPVYEQGNDEALGEIELSCCYGSFGIAKVFTPMNVVQQIAGDRLLSDVVTEWLRGTGAAPSENELRLEIRPAVLLHLPASAANDLSGADALYSFIDSEGKIASAGIVGEAVNAFNDTLHPGIAEEAGDQLARTLRKAFDDFQWGQTSLERKEDGVRGAFSNRLRTSSVAVFRRVEAGLDGVIAEALKAPSRRFDYARAVLTRLAVEFEDVASAAQSHANDVRAQVAGRLEDRDSLLGYAANSRSRFTRRTIAKVAIDDQAHLIALELEGQIWDYVEKGARDIVRLIRSAGVDAHGARSSLFGALDQLREDLGALKQRLQSRVTGLEGRHESILNRQVVPKNPEAYYRKPDNRPVDQEYVLQAERGLYGDEAVMLPTPWAARNRFLGSAATELLDRLSDYGSRTMSHVTRNAEDVVTLLDRQFSGADAGREYEKELLPYIQSGTAWLATRATERRGGWRSAIDFTVRRPRASKGAMDKLDAVSALRQVNAHPFEGPNDTIYFEQEVAAFPLSVLPRIRDYRDKAYLPALQQERGGNVEAKGAGGGLHIELNIEKYVDLVEPTKEEATRRSGAIQLFIEALIKGCLTPQRDRFGLVHYAYRRPRGMSWENGDVGRYDRAVRTFMNVAASQTLRNQVENVEVSLRALPDHGLLIKGRMLAILDRYIREDGKRPIGGQEWERNAERLNQQLQARWGPEAFKVGAAELPTLDKWGVFPLQDSGHVVPPDLPPPTGR